MSMFNLKGGGTNNWNYADKDKENYAEYIQGTVVAIDNPQSINFATKKPEVYDDGNPKRNLRITLLQQDGSEICWTFSGYRKSAAVQAVLAAMDAYDKDNDGHMKMLLGLAVTIWTEPGTYSMSHPRPWWVRIDGPGNAGAVRGWVDYDAPENRQAAPTPPAPAPARQQAPQPPASMQIGTNPPPANVTQQVQQTFGVRPTEVEEVPTSVYDGDIPF